MISLAEAAFELCAVQLYRRAVDGFTPLITGVTFVALDQIDGRCRSFAAIAEFEHGDTVEVVFELPVAIDLGDPEWRERFDAALFDQPCKWPQ